MQTITQYEVQITKTSKRAGNAAAYQIYDDIVKRFTTREEAKKYLADQYYYCKTIKPMYQDGENGTAIKVGKIYCYKVAERNYHGENKTYICQDWVTVKETISKPILL